MSAQTLQGVDTICYLTLVNIFEQIYGTWTNYYACPTWNKFMKITGFFEWMSVWCGTILLIKNKDKNIWRAWELGLN